MPQAIPRVAIALAIYNPDISFLKQQIFSLQQQSFQNWQCVVSDDSEDEIKSQQVEKLLKSDSRFQYVRNLGPKGVLRNFENALRSLGKSFDYYCFSDQDDYWEPFKLEQLLQNFAQNKQAKLLHSDLSLIDEQGKLLGASCWQAERRPLSSQQSSLDLVIRNSVTGCTLMFHHSLYELALPFPDGSGKEYLHDHWLAVLAKVEQGLFETVEPLVRYRQHSHNVIGASQKSSSSVFSKFKKMKELKSKSTQALWIRQKLARDLIERIAGHDKTAAKQLEVELRPVLHGDFSYFFQKLVMSKGQWPEFGLWLQLSLGSLWDSKRSSSSSEKKTHIG